MGIRGLTRAKILASVAVDFSALEAAGALSRRWQLAGALNAV